MPNAVTGANPLKDKHFGAGDCDGKAGGGGSIVTASQCPIWTGLQSDSV